MTALRWSDRTGGLTRPHRHSEAVRIPSRCTRLLRGQQRCDLRPTTSNLMDDESLEEGFDGTRGDRVDICV
jgi:hypothetical protein